MDVEQFLNILSLVGPFLAALPGIYAIRRQLKLEKVENEKLMAEAESISADVAAKYIQSAGNLQDFYVELIEEVKKQFRDCKEIVSNLESKIDVLTEKNVELEFKIQELENGIEILTKQIIEYGLKPQYTRGKK